jgi:hypothetical protein
VNGGPNPQPQQIDPAQMEQARRQINQIAEEIAQLSEAELAPADYYREFLDRMLFAAQAGAGAIWLRTPQGNLILQYQVNMREVGLDSTQFSRPMHDELLRQAATEARAGIAPPQTSRGQGEAPDQLAGNPTEYAILLVPIVYDKAVVGLIEIFQDPRRPDAAQQGLLQFMVRMATLASAFTRNQQLRQMNGQQQVWLQIETFSRQIHASLNPTEVAYLIANDGRRLVECDRISVALRTGRKSEVLAISGADVVEKRSNLVQLMRALFDAVLNWGEKLIHTGTKDDTLPPTVLHALDAYLAESNSKLLVIVPLKDERDETGKKKARSALMMECFETNASAEQLLAKLDVVGKHACPALYNAAEYRRIPMRFIWMPLAYLQDGMGGKAKAITTLVIAALTALVLALIFVPYPLKMDAKGQLLPTQREWLFAPVPGNIEEIKSNLASGSKVHKDQELMRLFDFNLHEQIRKLQLEIATAESKSRAPVPKGLDGNDNKEFIQQKLEAEITKRAKQDEFDRLVRRTNANPNNPGEFSLRSPMAGIVLSADFRENLKNRGVKPNEPLIRIGYTDLNRPKVSDWETELKIPQKHVGQVLAAFKDLPPGQDLDVDLLVVSAPTQVFKAKLRRDKIASQANPNKDDNNEPEPVVLAWARLHGDDIPADSRLPTTLLLSGTEVHSRIRCGNRPMGYSLFYGVWEFLYEKVVFFF